MLQTLFYSTVKILEWEIVIWFRPVLPMPGFGFLTEIQKINFVTLLCMQKTELCTWNCKVEKDRLENTCDIWVVISVLKQ